MRAVHIFIDTECGSNLEISYINIVVLTITTIIYGTVDKTLFRIKPRYIN